MTDARPVRGVLFDVDGTLYHQTALRAFMALELAAAPILRRSLVVARRDLWALRAFRRAREELRGSQCKAPLERLQFERGAKRAQLDARALESIVVEWIFERPLKYMHLCRRRGLAALLDHLESLAIRAGAFSDYPVRAKLEALGVAERMSAALCATDREINAFKPHPQGFARACKIWGLEPGEVLYVGDRPGVDAAGAANAGMPCAILIDRLKLSGRRDGRIEMRSGVSVCFTAVSSFSELQDEIDRRCS